MFKNVLVNYIAGRHVAGSSLKDAVNVYKYAGSLSISAALSAWTYDNEDMVTVTQKYVNILNAINNYKLTAYLSIKPSAINFNTDCFKILASAARVNNTRIHFDSLSPEMSGQTLEFLEDACLIYSNIGYTIPSRWARSLNDARKIAELKLPAVRIVKGQWQDPGNTNINAKENYLKIVEYLAGKIPTIAVATHDEKLIKRAIEIINQTNSYCEVEQFFSLPLNGKKIAEKYNISYRVYIAFGSPYMPYNLKFILERPAMIYWLIRDILKLKPKFSNLSALDYIRRLENNVLTKN